MKLFYASSISYPSPYANRIQTLRTAEAFGTLLGDRFCLGARDVKEQELYRHALVNFGLLGGPALAWKQMRFIRRGGYDTVFCREHRLLFLLMLYDQLLFRSGLAFFYEEHEVLAPLPFTLKYVLAHARGVVVTAGSIAEDLGPALAQPYLVARNGVDYDLFSTPTDVRATRGRSDLPEDAPIALYAGSVGVHAWKGTDTFLASHQLLPLQARGTVYVLLGADAGASSGDPAIRFLPRMEQADVAALLQAADVLVLPNTGESVTSRRHTSPVKLFEYMASGTPIVASDLPSIREVVDESAVRFVRAGDPEALTAGIAEALSDSAGSLSRAARAQEEAKKYTWAARATRITDFMERYA
jgi:glycosyltransferase involved in cell wall biosynthesis